MPTKPIPGDPSWAEEEFAMVALNDVRLNHRCQVLASALEQQPTVPINQACEDWADTKAAYRFMDNPKVSPAALLAPHCQRTVERMKAHALVLAVQDTTFSTTPRNRGPRGWAKSEPKSSTSAALDAYDAGADAARPPVRTVDPNVLHPAPG